MDNRQSLGKQLYASKPPASVITHVVIAVVIALAAIGLALFYTYPMYKSSRPGEYGGVGIVAVMNAILLVGSFFPILRLLELRIRQVIFFEHGVELETKEDHTRLRYDELEKAKPYVIEPNPWTLVISLLLLNPGGIGAGIAQARTYWRVEIQKRGSYLIRVQLPNEWTYERIREAIANSRSEKTSELGEFFH